MIIEKKNEYPLVSIIVLTYNSSKYVIETLESVKKQTYKNIELIISDDCSTDNTVEVCSNWINQHQAVFQRTFINTAKQNSGISSNFNKAIKECRGEWIKGIGGDDFLLKNCIEDNISFCLKNKNVMVLHSIHNMYKESFEQSNFICAVSYKDVISSSSKITCNEQYQLLLRKDTYSTPTMFFHHDVFLDVVFDESIPMIEDWPLRINLTNRGHKIYFMNISTVNYRARVGSVSRPDKKLKINTFHISQKAIFDKYISNKLPLFERLAHILFFKILFLLDRIQCSVNKLVYNILSNLMLMPIYYFIQICNRFIAYRIKFKYRHCG